jgi:cytochrome o ubiquinol oxidase subunit I
MLLRGFADALMMRSQQALAVGTAQGYLPPEHYNQIFSAHGTIMIFFVAMPLVIGLMNFAVPLQLGARDVAFPVLNSVSFWLTASGAPCGSFSQAPAHQRSTRRLADTNRYSAPAAASVE